ncbi:hypothetical protein GF312_17730 [Candidatus Poribacteria bacterium]|nr:hypothetical protein [Candidatus Poribacteria bacterium]
MSKNKITSPLISEAYFSLNKRMRGIFSAFENLSIIIKNHLVLVIIIIFTFNLTALSQTPYGRGERYGDREEAAVQQEEYKESPLRRFEIIFTISLPFTALHSYFSVRGVEMIRQQKVSPNFSDSHWQIIGGLTVLYSGFVAFWDYMHNRDKEINNYHIPDDDYFQDDLMSGILNQHEMLCFTKDNISFPVLNMSFD